MPDTRRRRVVQSKYFNNEDDEKPVIKKKKMSTKKPPSKPTTNTKANKRKINKNQSNDESDDDDDWEEVEEAKIFDPDEYQPEIPDKIQITMNSEQKTKKKCNNIDPVLAEIRQRINRARKELQLMKHQCCIILSVYHLKYLNSLILNNQLIQALSLSMKYEFIHGEEIKSMEKFVAKFIRKFLKIFKVSLLENHDYSIDIEQELIRTFDRKIIEYELIFKLLLLIFLRSMKQFVRLCCLIDPLPKKPSNLLGINTKNKAENDENQPTNFYYWIEIFDKQNNRWISYDHHHHLYDNSKELIEKMNKSIDKPTYVFAIDNHNNVNDVSARYIKDWISSDLKKRRIDQEWLAETLNIFNKDSKCNNDNKYKNADEFEFEKILSKIELPKRMSDYKNHPLFVLTKDLLKFQAIYPPDSPPVGFFRNEPVYSRNCVHTLRSRETWLRDARTVRLNEQPYKYVQSRFKWKTPKNPNEKPEKEMIGVFGEWQTEPYVPPKAANGIVPRNGYGNVDLYKDCMLPIGCCHLKLPGLLRIANKLNIDCVPAIVGFDGTGQSYPVMDGYVVCNEFKDILIDAWKQEQRIQQEREDEKRQKRVETNWKRLIRGLIIKNNLKIKYGF